jgi:hypothetical protein
LLCLQPSDNLLKQQLQQLQEKGPSAWMLYCDDTAAAKAGSGGKAPKALYDSWDEFEEHVVNTHLVRRCLCGLLCGLLLDVDTSRQLGIYGVQQQV